MRYIRQKALIGPKRCELYKQITKTLIVPVPTVSLPLSQPISLVSWKVPYDRLIKEEKVWALSGMDLLSALKLYVASVLQLHSEMGLKSRKANPFVWKCFSTLLERKMTPHGSSGMEHRTK